MMSGADTEVTDQQKNMMQQQGPPEGDTEQESNDQGAHSNPEGEDVKQDRAPLDQHDATTQELPSHSDVRGASAVIPNDIRDIELPTNQALETLHKETNGQNSGGKTPDEVGGPFLPRSDRSRKLTEKGLQYQIELSVKRVRVALTSHAECCKRCELYLTESDINLDCLYEYRDKLESDMLYVTEAYYGLGRLSDDERKTFDSRFHDCSSANRQTLLKLTQAIRRAEYPNSCASSHGSHSMHSKDTRRSHASRCSNSQCQSHVSAHSKHSSVSSIKIAAAAKAAELRAKLKYLDEENEHKLKLERLSIMKDIEVQEAQIQVMKEIELESVRAFNADNVTQSVTVKNICNETKPSTCLATNC